MLNLTGHPRGCQCLKCQDFDDEMRADAELELAADADAKEQRDGE